MGKKVFDNNDILNTRGSNILWFIARLGRVLLRGFLLSLCAVSAASAQNPDFGAATKANEVPVFDAVYPEDEFCATAGVGGLCPAVPVDVPEFDANFIYRFVAYQAQRPFDRFSWQAMVSLVWPYDGDGNPIDAGYRHPDAGHAWWETYRDKYSLFAGASTSDDHCRDDLPDGALVLSAFVQASGDVLIDQAGNFVLYQTRVNDSAADYIRWNGLDSAAGRMAFAQSGQSVDFPILTLSAGAGTATGDTENLLASDKTSFTPGAQMIKFAWRIMTDPADQERYYTKPARIAIAAKDSVDGRAKCLDVTVGMVGLHIVQRVKSGNGDRWIWSTFEHVDNAPLASNARRPNSIIADDLFPEGCLAPDKTDRDYAFYDGVDRADHLANQIVQSDLRWADTPPYARDPKGNRVTPPDIVRCWRLFSGTAEANFVWQRKLGDSVWKNYFLVGTQWIGNGGGAPFGVGEVPRFLSNVALESFIQHQMDGSCLGCHSSAFTDAGQPSNFTFLLDPGR